MSDRQLWLLIYFLSRFPIGIAAISAVPAGCDIEGRWYGNPGGIGMANIRGLQKRGYITEPKPGLFYLTEEGVLAAYRAAEDKRWA